MCPSRSTFGSFDLSPLLSMRGGGEKTGPGGGRRKKGPAGRTARCPPLPDDRPTSAERACPTGWPGVVPAWGRTGGAIAYPMERKSGRPRMVFRSTEARGHDPCSDLAGGSFRARIGFRSGGDPGRLDPSSGGQGPAAANGPRAYVESAVPDRPEDLVCGNPLEHVAGGSRRAHLHHTVAFGSRGQGEHASLRRVPQDLAGGPGASSAWHLDVDDGNIGPGGSGEFNGFDGILCHADEFQGRVSRNQRGQRCAHDRRIFGHQDPDGHRLVSSLSLDDTPWLDNESVRERVKRGNPQDHSQTSGGKEYPKWGSSPGREERGRSPGRTERPGRAECRTRPGSRSHRRSSPKGSAPWPGRVGLEPRRFPWSA